MGGAVGPHPMAQHSMGMGGAPAANMGMIPGMTMTGSNMMQPPGQPLYNTTLYVDFYV